MIRHVFIDLKVFNKNRDFYTSVFKTFWKTISEEYIESQLQNGVFFNLILEDDKPATLARWSITDNRKTVFVLRQIDTLPQHQRKGYGVLCINKGVENLKRYGCRKIISFADESNDASIKMHRKAGFVVLKDSSYSKSRYSWEGAIAFSKLVEKSENNEKE